MSDYRRSTGREDWTYIAECPNNGDCQPIIDNPDAPDDPVDCEHLTLEAEAKNSEYPPEALFPIEECPVCGADLDISSDSKPFEVLD